MSRFSTIHRLFSTPVLQLQLGETLSYTPSGSTARNVTAIVRRETIQDNNGMIAYQVVVYVAKADIATPKVGADVVALKRRESDTSNTTMTVAHITSSDGGMWEMLLR